MLHTQRRENAFDDMSEHAIGQHLDKPVVPARLKQSRMRAMAELEFITLGAYDQVIGVSLVILMSEIKKQSALFAASRMMTVRGFQAGRKREQCTRGRRRADEFPAGVHQYRPRRAFQSHSQNTPLRHGQHSLRPRLQH
jgi:hypothetical protein